MLNEHHIRLIALVISFAGIAMLLLLGQGFEPLEVKIADIDDSLVGSSVSVDAKVASSYQKGTTLFLQLDDGTGKIKAVLFRPRKEQLALLGKNKFASVEGKVQLYRDELEIIVERVEAWE